MTHVLTWLYRYRAVGWAFALVYFVTVVTTHDVVQAPALRLQATYGYEFIHYVIAALLLGSVALVFRGVGLKLKSHSHRQRMLLTGIGLLILSFIVFSTLMLRSIESIHFFQYLILTLVLCALLRSPLPAVLLGTVAGVIDEGWQYFYLHKWQPYYDFNDIIMNTTGALQGAWLFALFRPKDDSPLRPRASLWLKGWVICMGFVVILLSTGQLRVYRSEDRSGIELMRRPAPGGEVRPVNWKKQTDWGNTWFVVHPLLGLFALFVLPLAVLGLPHSRQEDSIPAVSDHAQPNV